MIYYWVELPFIWLTLFQTGATLEWNTANILATRIKCIISTLIFELRNWISQNDLWESWKYMNFIVIIPKLSSVTSYIIFVKLFFLYDIAKYTEHYQFESRKTLSIFLSHSQKINGILINKISAYFNILVKHLYRHYRLKSLKHLCTG